MTNKRMKLETWFHNNICTRLTKKPFRWMGCPYRPDALGDNIQVSAYKCIVCKKEIYSIYNSKTDKTYRSLKYGWDETKALVAIT